MKYNEYTFELTEAVNPFNTHAIVVHFFGKDTDKVYSAIKKDYDLVIRTTEALVIPENKKIRSEYSNRSFMAILTNVETKDTNVNDEVIVSGSFSLTRGRHSTESRCPVLYEEVNVEELKSWLKNKVGVDLVELINVKTIEPEFGLKVHIHNQFNLTAKVKVSDKVKFELSQVKAIGCRKSYGLGAVEVL